MGIQRVFGFSQKVEMTRSMMDSLFDETSLFVSALTAASSIPSTLQASLLFTVARWFTLINEKFDLED